MEGLAGDKLQRWRDPSVSKKTPTVGRHGVEDYFTRGRVGDVAARWYFRRPLVAPEDSAAGLPGSGLRCRYAAQCGAFRRSYRNQPEVFRASPAGTRTGDLRFISRYSRTPKIADTWPRALRLPCGKPVVFLTSWQDLLRPVQDELTSPA